MLYVTATPIGNLSDMSARAIEVLANADIIAAEDTRDALSLLSSFGISGGKLVSYHKFNEEESAEKFVEMLKSGKNIALISDAGTPCVSDPGYLLVKKAAEAGIEITGVCGPSAAVTALSLCGFNTLSFSFFGFLPRAKKDLRTVFERLKSEYSPISVFYESPKRIKDTLAVLSEQLPEAALCLCNDLTKRFERVYRGNPESVLSELNANEKAEKGEYTLVIDRGQRREAVIDDDVSVEAQLVDVMVKNGASLKEAVTVLCESRTVRKNQAYSASLNLKNLLGE